MPRIICIRWLGQGLNLALRDVAALTGLLTDAVVSCEDVVMMNC
ncbi:MAG: hypothetical protein R3E95_13390 [Thiolinea sp.]